MIQEMKNVDDQMNIILAGSIYVEDAKELREKIADLIEKGQINLLFDLSQVDYIDSTGLGMFVSINKQAQKRGGSIMLKGLQGLVKEVFELTRLTKVFEIQ